MTRPLLALLLAFALVAGLAACGGGGSSSSSTASTPTSTKAPATTPAAPAGAAKPSATPKPSTAAVASETAADRRAAGRAAPFVAPESDNSVPTFGSEAAASDRAQAETALKAYLQARAREDWASACRELAAPTRQGYEKLATSSSKAKALSCAQVLAALSKGADLSDPLTGALVSLRVHGQNAFALFYGPAHQQYMVPMNREAGVWRPTQASPIAYPPGAPSATSP
jgi:hypothetical protein